jgi:hypothetical protein
MGAGRPKKLTPESLWTYFVQYQKYAKENPKLKHDFVGKDADEVYRQIEIPLTWEGLQIFIWNQGLNGDLKDYLSNKNDAYNEFSPILARIRTIIYEDKFTGAAAGLFNHSIIARDLGLKEQSDVTSGGEKINQVINWGGKEIQI